MLFRSRYVLTFKRAKLIATSIYNFDIIKTVTTRTFNYAGVLNNECTIILMDNCDQELFVFGYSEQNNISVVIFQNDPKDNILYNIPDGTYWFFAQNQLIPDLYDSMRVKITAGEIEIIPDSIENPQIITEDETVNDEGTIVPE